MVEDLCPPPGERPSEALDFGHFVGDASSDGLVHEKGRVSWTVDEIDVSDGFFGQPCPADLIPWVPDP